MAQDSSGIRGQLRFWRERLWPHQPRGPRSGSGGSLYSWENFRFAVKWCIIPAGTVVLVVGGAGEIGPAHRAATGHGTRGYWVAELQDVCRNPPCGWLGNFVLPDGQVSRYYVSYIGKHGPLHQGSRLPAIDTGGPKEVFPRNESQAGWIGDLAGIIIGAIGFPLWLWRVPYRWFRSRIRGPDPLVPSI